VRFETLLAEPERKEDLICSDWVQRAPFILAAIFAAGRSWSGEYGV